MFLRIALLSEWCIFTQYEYNELLVQYQCHILCIVARGIAISTKSNKKTANKAAKKETKTVAKASDEAISSGSQKIVPPFPVVGIGASAGGLEALTKLLHGLDVDTGMAFVVIQHLAPSHESMLAELLSRETAMTVREVIDGTIVKPNHIYIIPPNSNLGILHGVLHLIPREDLSYQHLPIDFFLRSLASEMSNRAIGVILSGSASDGVMGLKEIKAAGGITFAQSEESSAYASMPHSAIAAGCVDFILKPEKIGQELSRIGSHPYLTRSHVAPAEAMSADEDQLRKIFLLLRQYSGNDFTFYKQSTILRRINRRILLHKLEHLEDYVRYLQSTPGEVEALFRDLLINVTSFFRDPEIFDALKESVYPVIVKDRPDDVPIRVWVPGCSTGEEVYSIAITLFEYISDARLPVSAKFFATDLDEQAVEKARKGIYPPSITENISTERLQRYFVRVDEGYQISKSIRDACVFARQNVLKDPPFSKLDLISCRNLLIYLSPVLQKKLMPVFHYALNAKGMLLLGTSETIGRNADLFRLIDKKYKIYEKKSVPGSLPVSFSEISTYDTSQRALVTVPTDSNNEWTSLDLQREADRIVLKKYSPCGVVIDSEMDVQQFRGRTGEFLEPAVGEASLNLIKMAQNGLKLDLRNAVVRAFDSKVSQHMEGIRIQVNKSVKLASFDIEPILNSAGDCYYLLVLFWITKTEPLDRSDETAEETLEAVESEELLQLKKELSATREYLHSVIEQQEVTNEELTSANEEIQASNEELQSTNEELETAKEELQSSNEELTTVNDEIGNRNIELEELTNDLTNLITGLSIPIVMVNESLRIRRFSMAAEELLNIIPEDKGRPITHIKSGITVPDFEAKLLKVINDVVSDEIEVMDDNGCWYSVNIRPYKTVDNKINGAVIAYLDIDDMKTSLLQADHARQYAESIIAAIKYPMLVLDKYLRVVSASEAFYRVFMVTEKETVDNLLYRLGNGQWGIPDLRKKLEAVVVSNKSFKEFKIEHDFENIGLRKFVVSGNPIKSSSSQDAMVLMQIEEIIEKV